MKNRCILKQSESELKEFFEMMEFYKAVLNKIRDPNFFNHLVKDDPTGESLHEKLEEYLTEVSIKLAKMHKPKNLTEKEWND